MGVLLLNATYEPLTVIGLHRAICLIIAGRAEIVDADTSAPVRSPSMQLPRPTVVRLIAMAKVPFRQAPLTRAALRARDQDQCQVSGCDRAGTTIDHVIPRSRYQHGNPHRWDNVVLMCEPHNSKKGNRTLDEIGWTLKAKPRAPYGPLILAPRTSSWSTWTTTPAVT